LFQLYNDLFNLAQDLVGKHGNSLLVYIF